MSESVVANDIFIAIRASLMALAAGDVTLHQTLAIVDALEDKYSGPGRECRCGEASEAECIARGCVLGRVPNVVSPVPAGDAGARTDTERLDWLEHTKVGVTWISYPQENIVGWYLADVSGYPMPPHGSTWPTLRDAIDDSMSQQALGQPR